MFLISNMYPSKKDPLFGVFVKNFKDLLENNKVQFSAISVIKGKRSNSLEKLFSYARYYFSILYNYFFKKFDVVYVHYLSHNSPILTLLLFKKTKPIVVNVHGTDILSSKGKKIDRLNKRVLKRTDLVVVPSEYFKDLMLTNYPFLHTKKIFVSPSGGVDCSRFYPTSKSDNFVPILGMISRIDRGKGWEIFLDSLRILRSRNIVFEAIIAGQGLEEKQMLQKIKDLKLEKEVNFLGLVKQDELVHLYNKLDAMIFPTKREAESLGLVGLEAMSCKTPVIGSNIAGLKTYIEHNKNGLLFEPGNAKDLADNIEVFLNLTLEEKNAMKENAFETSKRYEAKNVMTNLYKKLQTLC